MKYKRFKSKRKRAMYLFISINCIICLAITATTYLIVVKHNNEREKLISKASTKAVVININNVDDKKEEPKEPEPEENPVEQAPTPEPQPAPDPAPTPETTPTPTPTPAPEIEIGDDTTLDSLVRSLPVIGLGDSIMLGAVPTLNSIFPNGYFDGAVSRQIWNSFTLAQTYAGSGYPIVINLGANGNVADDMKRNFINIFGDKDVFWLTVTNNYMVGINDSLKAVAAEYPNVHIIDWEAISAGHPEYFYGDGIHLTAAGATAYANSIYSAIYSVYSSKYPDLN